MTGHASLSSEIDEGPHQKSGDAFWQESVLFHWYDENAGVGGFQRIGHEPNFQGGRAAVWSFIFHGRDGWQFRRGGDVPLTRRDEMLNGFGAGSHACFIYKDGAAHWSMTEEDLSVELRCHNFFPIVDPWPHDDAVAATRFAHHFEVAGRVEGVVRYKGRETKIDGLGYRDHSWSPRDWSKGLLVHRWFTGTFGPDLSFAAITAQANDGRMTRVGFIARGQEIIRARTVDAIPFMEPDGLTHRGGFLRLGLTNGETFEATFTPVGAAIFPRGQVAMVEMICEAQHRGRRGYCDAEVSTNPRNGSGPIHLALNATLHEGFAPFKPLRFE